MPTADPPLVLVSVGNTRTRFATAGESGVEPSRVMPNAEQEALAAAIVDQARSAAGEGGAGEGEATVVIASVNHPVADRLERDLLLAGDLRVLRFGREIAIPVPHTLADAATIGQDRLLNALGAFWRSRQACIVIDAGTAVTVDFVDGEGTFHGGAIAPGLHMMAEALHTGTAALPKAQIAPALCPGPDDPPFGKTTVQAINVGVAAAVQGLAHLLIDRYAQYYEAYPRVVATGGDAPRLFENDPLVEHVVPDLTLLGMLAAWQIQRDHGQAEEGDEGEDGEEAGDEDADL